jgi:hypothetical protein
LTSSWPSLDDRDFEQLRADAIAFVRNRGSSWTDLSDGDPGLVLIEAFAYLTDMLLYRVNRVPGKARREFLALLGTRAAAPGAAFTTLRFSRSADETGQPVTIPVGTRIRTADGSEGEPVVFVTDEPATLEPGGTEATAAATHCQPVDAELLGVSNGEPGQEFKLASAPVIRATGPVSNLVVGVEADQDDLEARPDAVAYEGRAYALWTIVDSFAGLAPGSRAVRVDRVTGLVAFAPAVRIPAGPDGVAVGATPLAAIPPVGRQVRAWYRTGGGSRGNVAAGTLTAFDGDGIGGVTVTNPVRAAGGADAESPDEAVRRASSLFHEPRRAVTADDFEHLARAEPGVARARAITEAEHWAHATAGTVEVRLVPTIDSDQPPQRDALLDAQVPQLVDRVTRAIEERQPLGVRTVVRWARYKEVTVTVTVVVGRAEDPAAVERRVEERLHRVLSPVPVAGNREGWPYGQALRASNVYNAVFTEPGVRYAEDVVMELSQCPDGDVGALAADRLQRDVWYCSQGATLFRSENGAVGWEAVHTFGTGTIERIETAQDRPGHVAVAVRGPEGRLSQVFVSRDCGSSWSDGPVAALAWESDELSHAVQGLCWMPAGHDDDLLLATDRGLYTLQIGRTLQPKVVDPAAPDRGCWTVAVTTTAEGSIEVAVAMQSRSGVWLLSGQLDGAFHPVGLDGVDVRKLLIERRNIRTFLWAPTFAVADDPGTGCYRTELRGSAELVGGWEHFDRGWAAGICHDVAFLGDVAVAASERGGVLTLDQRQPEPTWQSPSVRTSGLPLLENRRFQPTRAVDAAGGVALVGTGQSVYRTVDGVTFADAARRAVTDIVTLPPSWLFVSGRHQVDVRLDDR